MRFDNYKFKYRKAYEKAAGQLNLMAPEYTDDQLDEAWRIYSDTSVWYHRAFKPSNLASTSIIYYPYQIRTAFPGKTDAELTELIDNYPDLVDETIRRSFHSQN